MQIDFWFKRAATCSGPSAARLPGKAMRPYLSDTPGPATGGAVFRGDDRWQDALNWVVGNG